MWRLLSGKDRWRPGRASADARRRLFRAGNLGLELISDRLGDFTLNAKRSFHVAIVGLRPKMGIGAGVDELRVDAQTIARPLHAAFQKMCDAEFLPDLP